MTFIALGVFDKVKNISITDVTKKLKDYVHVTPDKDDKNIKVNDNLPQKPIKHRPSQSQLMEIQLKQYKKLLSMQERIVSQHQRVEKQKIERQSKKLQQLNKQLIETEAEQRISRQKQEMFNSIDTGKRTIGDIIQENILIKEKLYLASQQ